MTHFEHDWSVQCVIPSASRDDRPRQKHLKSDHFGAPYACMLLLLLKVVWLEKRPLTIAVDGLWMDWEAWSQCTVSCGGGSRVRTRQCYGNQHGGKTCEGNSTETGECETQNCPGIVHFLSKKGREMPARSPFTLSSFHLELMWEVWKFMFTVLCMYSSITHGHTLKYTHTRSRAHTHSIINTRIIH